MTANSPQAKPTNNSTEHTVSILIVDDAELIRELLSINLKKFGYESTTASNGRDALQLINISDFDMVLLDVVMPDISGLEVLKEIRQQYEMIELPVIMVTAIDDSSEIVKALEIGANDYITKPIDFPVVIARLKTHLALKNLTSQLEEKNTLLAQLATIDELTGIPNRRFMNQYLEHEWERATRYQTRISLIFIDVDYFKAYNDFYGHNKGDETLKKIANTLPGLVRRKIDLVARYGGEEFVIIMPDTSEEDVIEIGKLINSQIEALMIPHEESDIGDHVTISLGIASIIPDASDSTFKLLELADQRLYKAKQMGRNRQCHE